MYSAAVSSEKYIIVNFPRLLRLCYCILFLPNIEIIRAKFVDFHSGAGQEVGRSCIMLEFKKKKIMLDCGIHPGLSGMDALPFVDMIEANEVDLLFISQYV